jgi:hypothetical protein
MSGERTNDYLGTPIKPAELEMMRKWLAWRSVVEPSKVGSPAAGRYLERREDMARLARVHVCSHSRQRQTLVSEMTLASVPTILPSQEGHLVGRATASAGRNSDIREVSHRFSHSTVPL